MYKSFSTLFLTATLIFTTFVGCHPHSKSQSEKSSQPNSEHILPLCCNTDRGDVISYQCINTLRTSSKEVLFKRKSWLAPKHLLSTKKATKFKFVNTSLKCFYGQLVTTLSLKGPVVKGRGSQRHHSYFTPDGYFKYEDEYYRPNEYCVSGLTDSRLEVKFCRANCSDPNTPCIQKCCGLGQIYSFGYGDNPRGCVEIGHGPNNPQWSPNLYHNAEQKLNDEEFAALNPHIVQKFPTTFKFKCRFNKTTVFPHGQGISNFLSALTQKTFRNLEFRLRKDGWLLYPGGEDESTKSRAPIAKLIDNYCVDGAQDYGESSQFSNFEGQSVLFLCSGGVDEAFDTPPPTQPIRQITTQTSPKPQVHYKPSPSSTFRPISISPRTPGIRIARPPLPISTTQITLPQNINTSPRFSEANPNPPFSNFKDKVELELSDSSSAQTSLEIEIEDGVPLNSLENDNEKEPESEKFIPALLPQMAMEMGAQQQKPSPTKVTIVGGNGPEIPTCCIFGSDVNDGFTHHCRNWKSGNSSNPEINPVEWNIPQYFMTRDQKAKFPFRKNPLKCGLGKFQFQGFIHNFEQIKGKSSGEKRHGILSDGYLKYDNEFYSPHQYCVNGLSPKILEVLICKPDCSMWETPCINRCCGMDEIYNLGLTTGHRGCQPLNPHEKRFVPTLHKNMVAAANPEEMGEIQPHFIQKYPPTFQQKCYNKITLAFPYSRNLAQKLTPEAPGTAFKHLQFRFRKDGKLMYTFPNSEDEETSFDAIYDRGEFCVDGVRDYGEKEHFQNFENQTILFICASEPQSEEGE